MRDSPGTAPYRRTAPGVPLVMPRDRCSCVPSIARPGQPSWACRPRRWPPARVVACAATRVLRSTTVVARRGKGKTHASRAVCGAELWRQQVVGKEGRGTARPPLRRQVTGAAPRRRGRARQSRPAHPCDGSCGCHQRRTQGCQAPWPFWNTRHARSTPGPLDGLSRRKAWRVTRLPGANGTVSYSR